MALPVEDILAELRHALARDRRAVLQAPPGAGKTTVVPLALLDAPWLGDSRIVMLEPRRVAARAAAQRMSSTLGEPVGQTVGFRTRTETRVSPRTRVEVVTEGILTRRLQRDPTLDGVGLVIFDEFHERSLVADLGLALTLHTRRLVRDDLRLLVMSATLDASAVARLLDDAPVITATGRVFPVETRYAPPRDPRDLEAAVAGVIQRALRDDEGDVLVFLPGAPEIHRVRAALGRTSDSCEVLSLFGALTAAEQDRALVPSGHRRVVLATSIAETSLTIPGVRVVVDAGLARRPRFSARTGMTRLETVRVSRATADQRRGRAGRTASGVCYRLWHEHEELVPASLPEIVEADLAPLALDLAATGITDPAELAWIDPPAPGPFGVARELLRELSLIDDRGALTPDGRTAAALPLHPRLAHMIVRAGAADARRMACDLAALLNERDFIRFSGPAGDADIRLRLEMIGATRARRGLALPAGAVVHRDAIDRIVRESDRLYSEVARAGIADAGLGTPDPGVLVALAYPDRVSMLRPGQRGRYVTREGGDVSIDPSSLLANEEMIVAAELDGKRPVSRAWLAASIDRTAVEMLFASQIETTRTVSWSDRTEAVTAMERRTLGAIVLGERAIRADPADVAAALLDAAIARGILDNDDLRAELARIAFARTFEPDAWPDLTVADLERTASDWLLPALAGMRSLADAARVDLAEAVLSTLDHRQRRLIDEIAPRHLVVPTGSRIRVSYEDPTAPAIAVRIQEIFGLAETPRVGRGRVPVTLHLLSPANRPVQVTRDLAGFWKNSYFDVRKDLRGRYPRHPWPDDPATAAPTRRARPR
ncbi:MAG TPA: ATP-dependent helicase HrpB [Gemmatimonadaceae bacterium]|nr:ATP-dependent helicase HrpB [Gemmatimonadaceae bacterium]